MRDAAALRLQQLFRGTVEAPYGLGKSRSIEEFESALGISLGRDDGTSPGLTRDDAPFNGLRQSDLQNLLSFLC
jgi:hypothetical protein